MSTSQLAKMADLEAKAVSSSLNSKDESSLTELRSKLAKQQANELPCPFKVSSTHPTCHKPGGVCSIRLYSEAGGRVAPVGGEKGRLRSLCPARLHQNGTVFSRIGEKLLSDPNPKRVGEVGFLKSTGSLDSAPGENVGRIDMILVKANGSETEPIDWVAVEVQAVYFSGKKMSIEFDYLAETQGKFSMARIKRRPDYRSSGVKRLMPQLQIKVPTLSRWGKKMAVVVDAPFFQSMGKMDRVSDVSNADIVWFLVDFVEDQRSGQFRLAVIEEVFTTLESATLGLTGGVPLTKGEFETRIREKALK